MNFHLLQSNELKRLSDTLYRLYEPIGPEHFSDQILLTINHLFPEALCSFDLINIHTGEVESLLSQDKLLTGTSHGDSIACAVRDFHHQNPISAYAANGGKSQILKISDFVSYRTFRNTDLYQAAFKPFGLKRQMAIVLDGIRGKYGGITINVSGREFSEESRVFLQLIQPHISRAYANAMLRAHAVDEETVGRDKGLTRREAEVFEWLAQGKRDAEIAIILGASRRTVEGHVARILHKLGVETRTAAVGVAARIRADYAVREP